MLRLYGQSHSFTYLVKDTLWGLADSNMKAIIPIEYEDIVVISPQCIALKKENKWTFFNEKAKMLRPYIYTLRAEEGVQASKPWDIEYATDMSLKNSKSYRPYVKAGKKAERGSSSPNERSSTENPSQEEWGAAEEVIDEKEYEAEESEEWESDNAYIQELSESDESLTLVEIKGKIELLTTRKTPKKEYDFLFQQLSHHGYFVVRQEGKIGLLTAKGKFVLACEYDEISLLDKEKKYLKVGTNGKYGVVDSLFNLVLPIEYADIWMWNHKLFVGAKKKLNGFDYNFKRYVKTDNLDIRMRLDYQYELFSLMGKKTTAPTQTFDMLALPKLLPTMVSKRSYALVQFENKFGMVNEDGKLKIPVIYNAIICETKNDYPLKVCRNGKWGFLDADGDLKIPLKYDEIAPFANYDDKRLAKVASDGKYGYINDEGEIIVPLQYDSLDRFSLYEKKWTAIAGKNGKFGLIDAEGNVLMPFNYRTLKWERGGKLVSAL